MEIKLSFESFLKEQNEEMIISLLHNRIKKSVFLLRQFPELGRYDKDINARIFPVQKTSFNIIFRIEKNVLEILRIFHTSQKWLK